MDYSSLTLTEKKELLYAQPIPHFPRGETKYNINADFLKMNSAVFEECERELFVSLFPMLPLLEKTMSLEDADYILYSHPYARVGDMSPVVLSQLKYIDEKRRPEAEIIVVGKSSNAEELLAGSIKNIVFWPKRYAELVARKFDMDFKDEYFVYDSEYRILNIWPVNGCLRKCKFCRRSYMDIPFESLSLEYIKSQLDWYKENSPEKLRYIRLRAENLTEYGLDLPGHPTLAGLFNLISSYDEVKSIDVILGLVISEFTDAMVDSVCRSGKFVHLAFNLEAGSPTLLKTIGKDHTPERALYITQKIREAIPHIYLSTTVMVGLPTETLSDIYALADLCIDTTMNSILINMYGVAPKYPLNNLSQLSIQLREYHMQLLVRLIKQKKIKSPNKDTLFLEYVKKLKRGSRKEFRLKEESKFWFEKYCIITHVVADVVFLPEYNCFVQCDDEALEYLPYARAQYLRSKGIIK